MHQILLASEEYAVLRIRRRFILISTKLLTFQIHKKRSLRTTKLSEGFFLIEINRRKLQLKMNTSKNAKLQYRKLRKRNRVFFYNRLMHILLKKIMRLKDGHFKI